MMRSAIESVRRRRRARRERGASAETADPSAEPLAGEEAAFEGFLAAELDRTRSRGTDRWRVLRRRLVAGDAVAAVIAGCLSLVPAGLPAMRGIVLVAVVVVGWIGIAVLANLYGAEDLRSWASGVDEVPRALLAALLLSWPLYGAALVLGADDAVLTVAATAFGVALLSPLARAAARTIVHRSEPLQQKCLVVGSGRVASQVVERLRERPEYGLMPVGIVDDEPHAVGAAGDLPTLGRLADLEDVLRVHKVDRVIIAFSRASHEQLLKAIRACRDRRVAVDIVPRLFEFLGSVNAIDQVGGFPLLSVGAPQLPSAARATKRALDAVGAALALVMLAPLLVIVAVAVKLDTRGPLLERRRRAGRGGLPFDELHFRGAHSDGQGQSRVGHVLRDQGLDALPRLINVLRGDMSFVGPRPISAWAPDSAAAVHQRRLDLRPGLTGPWHVSTATHDSPEDILHSDYRYVAGWSPLRDVVILLASVPATLFRTPAERLPD